MGAGRLDLGLPVPFFFAFLSIFINLPSIVREGIFGVRLCCRKRKNKREQQVFLQDWNSNPAKNAIFLIKSLKNILTKKKNGCII